LQEKPNDVTRLAFVGSHYLRGTNSALENIATTILEKEWNKNYPNKKIEVFNFCIPKYNIEMAYFLIKKFSQEYNIDYFIYVFDPQKDPSLVAGNDQTVNHAPALVFDENGTVKEKKDFTPINGSATGIRSFKTYQFLRSSYNFLKKINQNDNFSESGIAPDLFKPYPEVYFDDISTSTSEVIDRMAKVIDYTIDNSQSKVYILMLPPQQSQFFQEYEKSGNLDSFYQNQGFVAFIKRVQHMTIEDFMTEVLSFVKQVDNNHFAPGNLFIRLKSLVKNPNRLIEIDDEFLVYLEQPKAQGFLENWHRRDSGQSYLAKVLGEKVLPEILFDNN